MKPLTYGQAIALAEQFERRADSLEPSEQNLIRHANLLARAMDLRKIATRIARQQYVAEAKGKS